MKLRQSFKLIMRLFIVRIFFISQNCSLMCFNENKPCKCIYEIYWNLFIFLWERGWGQEERKKTLFVLGLTSGSVCSGKAGKFSFRIHELAGSGEWLHLGGSGRKILNLRLQRRQCPQNPAKQAKTSTRLVKYMLHTKLLLHTCYIILILEPKPGLMVHTFDPRRQMQMDLCGLSLKTAWSIEWVPG